GIKLAGDERGRGGELVVVARFEHDLDVRAVGTERRIRADEEPGETLAGFDEDLDDLALPRPVRAPPGIDGRPGGEPVFDRIEHRLHLCRQAGQDVDVLEHETGGPAQRMLEAATPDWPRGPA